MEQGSVKWFNKDKGFGYIMPDNGGEDVFVHINAVKKAGMETLSDGQRLEYEVTPGARGPTADSITAL